MKVVLSPKFPQFALALGIAVLMTACAAQPTVPETAEDAVAALEADTSAASTEEGEGADERICRSEVVTGTNFRRRTCRTAEEWEARAQRDRGVVDQRTANDNDQEAVDSAAGGTANAVGF